MDRAVGFAETELNKIEAQFAPGEQQAFSDLLTKDRKKILLTAIRDMETEFVLKLIFYGADVNVCDGYQNSALHFACFYPLPRVVKLLLDLKLPIGAVNNVGNTPLHLACEAQNREIVDTLIEHHADVNAQNMNGWTPLHTAVKNANSSVIHSLLQAGADRNLLSKASSTPLQCLEVEKEAVNIIKLLSLEEQPEDSLIAKLLKVEKSLLDDDNNKTKKLSEKRQILEEMLRQVIQEQELQAC
eukprot:Lithocolla_globosa_v1_NODE_290_length_4624_cov_1165.781571.p3 type:complete len:243 gc:universal NODE_290_length_4624_cov_1165.781571:3470-2742(-)